MGVAVGLRRRAQVRRHRPRPLGPHQPRGPRRRRVRPRRPWAPAPGRPSPGPGRRAPRRSSRPRSSRRPPARPGPAAGRRGSPGPTSSLGAHDEPPGHVARILAGLQGGRQPVEGGVGVAPPDALDEGADDAGPVVVEGRRLGGPRDVGGLDRGAAVGARHRDGGLEDPQQAPPVARRVADELAQGDLVEGHPASRVPARCRRGRDRRSREAPPRRAAPAGRRAAARGAAG